MKRLMILLSALLLVLPGACGKADVTPAEEKTKDNGGENSGENEAPSKNVLVAYFSFTGTTKGIASTIADAAGADLYEIVPEEAYGKENSNYYDESTRAYKEQKGTGGQQRPAISGKLENADSYDVIFIGHPIWYSKAPRVIFTFLDTYGFKGKKVIEFVTSVSTGIGTAETELKNTYKDITWGSGRKLNSSGALSEKDLKDWVKSCIQ